MASTRNRACTVGTLLQRRIRTGRFPSRSCSCWRARRSGVVGEVNWAGSYPYRAAHLHRPSCCRAAARDRRRRTPDARARLPPRFTGIGDAAELVSLDALPADVVIDHAARHRLVRPGAALRRVGRGPRTRGRRTAQPASLPHISVAGAARPRPTARATPTASSRPRSRPRAGQVRRRARTASRGATPDFDGSSSGSAPSGRSCASPSTSSRRTTCASASSRTCAGTRWSSTSTRSLRAATASASSPAGTTRRPVWSSPGPTERPSSPPSSSARARGRGRHPILGLDPVHCTPQLGTPGPWSDRLPHFRMGFTPSSARRSSRSSWSPPACRRRDRGRARARRRDLAALLQVCEIRTIAADPSGSARRTGRTRSASTSPGSGSSRPSSAPWWTSRMRLRRSRPDRTGASSSSRRPRRSRRCPSGCPTSSTRRAARPARRVPQRLAGPVLGQASSE